MDGRKVLLALAAVMGMVLVGPVRRPAHAYNSSTWYEDAGGFEQALRQQRALHAPVLVYFVSTGARTAAPWTRCSRRTRYARA